MFADAVHVRHTLVFSEKGSFAGWPANYGFWRWEHELLCVFAVGKMGDETEIHALDRDRPFIPRQARSLDGGQSWKAERFNGQIPGGRSLSADEHLDSERKIGPRVDPDNDLLDLGDPIDFFDRETVVMCARTGLSASSVGWFYTSDDRGHRWRGPYRFRGLDLPIAARTDIVPLGQSDALFMLTTAKSNGQEGRTFCARTRDGGQTFKFVSYIGDEPEGYRIMPSSTLLQGGRTVTAVRSMGNYDDKGWIDIFASDDQGGNWQGLGTAVNSTGTAGNPPALITLQDDRLALIYGYRDYPYGIRLRVSDDGGQSWGEEVILRSDGGTPDIGYPRVVQSECGDLTATYYFNDGEGLERYIAATSFNVT